MNLHQQLAEKLETLGHFERGMRTKEQAGASPWRDTTSEDRARVEREIVVLRTKLIAA